jgi:hypothetical protein
MKKQYRSSIILILFLLILPIFAIPVYAKPKVYNPAKSSLWFECTAGYKVFKDIMVFDSSEDSKPVGFFGIDIYHVHASSFGSNYDLAIYYIFNPLDDVIPIGLFSNNPALEGLFTINSKFTVTRNGLTLTANDLPTLDDLYLPSYQLITSLGPVLELPNKITIEGKPSEYTPNRIPQEFQEIPIPPIGIVRFRGTWFPTLIEQINIGNDIKPIYTEFFVFNVRVTIS